MDAQSAIPSKSNLDNPRSKINPHSPIPIPHYCGAGISSLLNRGSISSRMAR